MIKYPGAGQPRPRGEAAAPQGVRLSATFMVEPWIAAAAVERESGRPANLAGDDSAHSADLDDCEQRHRAAIALSALGSEQRVDIFRHMAEISPAARSPAQIARAFDLPVRVVMTELARLRRARLVREIGSGRRRTFYADNAQARECLELVHELAQVLRMA